METQFDMDGHRSASAREGYDVGVAWGAAWYIRSHGILDLLLTLS